MEKLELIEKRGEPFRLVDTEATLQAIIDRVNELSEIAKSKLPNGIGYGTVEQKQFACGLNHCDHPNCHTVPQRFTTGGDGGDGVLHNDPFAPKITFDTPKRFRAGDLQVWNGPVGNIHHIVGFQSEAEAEAARDYLLNL